MRACEVLEIGRKDGQMIVFWCTTSTSGSDDEARFSQLEQTGRDRHGEVPAHRRASHRWLSDGRRFEQFINVPKLKPTKPPHSAAGATWRRVRVMTLSTKI
jgi:hypothetical protein